jgi:ATP-dependent 26S proteasome regulatory subunit
MEELDAVFKGRENTTKTNVEKGVTMSTLLNVLNGTIQLNNAIVVMTTNHIELIDPALKRAGRLGDVVIHFDKPTQEEAEEQLELFYGTNAKLNNYNRELYNNADLRNICIVCDDVEKAIEMVNAGAKVNE